MRTYVLECAAQVYPAARAQAGRSCAQGFRGPRVRCVWVGGLGCVVQVVWACVVRGGSRVRALPGTFGHTSHERRCLPRVQRQRILVTAPTASSQAEAEALRTIDDGVKLISALMYVGHENATRLERRDELSQPVLGEGGQERIEAASELPLQDRCVVDRVALHINTPRHEHQSVGRLDVRMRPAR